MVSTPNLNVAGEAVQTGFWSEFAVGAVAITTFGEVLMLRLDVTPLGPATSPCEDTITTELAELA